jgi:hypothetical protein
MTNLDKKFIPLGHENLDTKKWILSFARELMSKKGFENGLAAAMLYSSMAEYIAENLLDNLKHFISISSYAKYSGIVFFDQTNEKNKPKMLGNIIGEIDNYVFPDKAGILGCLRKISVSRNSMMHEFAKADMERIKKIILNDIFIIQNQTEELVTKIDTIYVGLGPILRPPGNAVPATALPQALPEQENKQSKQ